MMKTVLFLIFLIFYFDMVKSKHYRIDVENRERPRRNDDTVVKPGQFPFLVALHSRDNIFVCSGSLISERKALSAAHCILQKMAEIVVAGSVDTQTNDASGVQTRNIIKHVVHPKYIKKGSYPINDLGIVTMESQVYITASVQTIKVAPEEKPSTPLVMIGNGNVINIRCLNVTSEKQNTVCANDGKVHFFNYRVKIDVSNNEAKRKRGDGDSSTFHLYSQNPMKRFCGSDAGGPIVNREPPHLLHGIHRGNDGNGTYDVSTTIAENHDWILKQLDDNPDSHVARRRNGQKAWKFEKIWILCVFCIIEIRGYILC